MISVFNKEIQSFFSSLVAYIVILVFLLVCGLFLWILPDLSVFESGYAEMHEFFNVAPWVFMLLIPAVTMRSFAEERQTGTIELLATKPISDFQIVLGKYLASIVIVALSLIPTFIFIVSLYFLSLPEGNIDLGGIGGSYLGLLFLGSAYITMGLFSSAITSNQVVSFILGLSFCFIFYALIEWMRGFTVISALDPILEFISMSSHFDAMGRGVLDTRDLVYFISINALFLFSTTTVLESRKW